MSGLVPQDKRETFPGQVAASDEPLVILFEQQRAGEVNRLHKALEDAGMWIGAILRHIDFLDGQIEQLTGMIEEQIRPFDPAVELLCTVVGIQHRGAQCIIGEIGADMKHFATARHLASWAGRCPGNEKSAGKRRSG